MKIHVRQTKTGKPACSIGYVTKEGICIPNGREKYQYMASEVVGVEEFRQVPDAERCAHCSNKFTSMLNARRLKAGKPLYSDAFTQTLVG
jgi:hypothetical protein